MTITDFIQNTMSSVRWAFNILKWEPTEKDFIFASSCLQKEEKDRIGKFVFKKDVKASLAGQLMIRKYVSECVDLPYDLIDLSRDINGKPVYESKNPQVKSVKFNVSHHGSYTVFVGECNTTDIGVDVMKLEYCGKKSLDEFFHTMSRNFSLLEWKNINGTAQTTEQEKIRMFYRNWALKESYIKAMSLGLKMNLSQLDFDVHSDIKVNCVTTDTSLSINNVTQCWQFEESLLDKSHCVAVALQKQTLCDTSANDYIFKELTLTNLLEKAVPLIPPDIRYCKNFFTKT